jgi:two-component system chemotaxis response regulator CheY
MAKKVLVVDDAEVIRDLIGMLLMDMDYDVAKASNGEQALDMLKTNPTDLVICDLNMPKMDGVQLVKAMRAHAPIAHLPVIMVTANDFGDKKSAAVEAGINGWFLKPFNNKELLAKVKELIG